MTGAWLCCLLCLRVARNLNSTPTANLEDRRRGWNSIIFQYTVTGNTDSSLRLLGDMTSNSGCSATHSSLINTRYLPRKELEVEGISN
ncbi:hypothetical protein F4804DRAFT_324362 [Jackrogersella minutella]|nr:hypothetical protein F4804DRAFT_324362 [Jackrogersella minutella]